MSMTAAENSLDVRVGTALQQSPFLSSRHLRFETEAGRVVLRGVVASFYQKQMATAALRRLSGVSHIENHLEVNWT